jgi:hypothetical protein
VHLATVATIRDKCLSAPLISVELLMLDHVVPLHTSYPPIFELEHFASIITNSRKGSDKVQSKTFGIMRCMRRTINFTTVNFTYNNSIITTTKVLNIPFHFSFFFLCINQIRPGYQQFDVSSSEILVICRYIRYPRVRKSIPNKFCYQFEFIRSMANYVYWPDEQFSYSEPHFKTREQNVWRRLLEASTRWTSEGAQQTNACVL